MVFLIRLGFCLQRHDDGIHPLGHTLAGILLQLLLPLLVGEARHVDGLDELTIAEHSTTGEIETMKASAGASMRLGISM